MNTPTNEIAPVLSGSISIGSPLNPLEQEIYELSKKEYEKDYIEQTFPEAHLNMPERVQIPPARMRQLRVCDETIGHAIELSKMFPKPLVFTYGFKADNQADDNISLVHPLRRHDH